MANDDNDLYAMYACKRCKYIVTPFEKMLPCPRCGNMTYRKVSPDDPLVRAQRPA